MARMTLEEKIGQLIALWATKSRHPRRRLDRILAAEGEPRLPRRLRPGDAPLGPQGRARHSGHALAHGRGHGALRQRHPALGGRTQTRLGIPVLFHDECLHGYMAVGRDDVSRWPSACRALSIPELVREVNSVIAREMRAHGSHLVLSPVVDIARDPRWGRIEETFGEDPYLCGEMGVASVLRPAGRGAHARRGQGLRDVEAHDRPRPAPVGRERRRPRRSRRASFARTSSRRSARWSRARHRVGHAFLQRDRRRAVAREPVAHRHACCAASGASTAPS